MTWGCNETEAQKFLVGGLRCQIRACLAWDFNPSLTTAFNFRDLIRHGKFQALLLSRNYRHADFQLRSDVGGRAFFVSIRRLCMTEGNQATSTIKVTKNAINIPISLSIASDTKRLTYTVWSNRIYTGN